MCYFAEIRFFYQIYFFNGDVSMDSFASDDDGWSMGY